MTKNECEILQDLRIINLILNDISNKTEIDDFFVNNSIEVVEKAVKDLEYVMNGGKE
ncbi:hypothetical protein [Enterococcus diestrammenae]|uniref:Uncharacterized protein n=1 Tax=Enterococcus diestrammenae TaxID=1155073 RepID=A0ABV0F1V7_9ENTE|nr:hypothetical protein [Enterococcus diestrammenae]